MLVRALYFVLIHLAAPVVFAFTALRGVRDRSYWERLSERFGYTRLQFSQAPIWIHAASVGEVQAATPLIRYLLAKPGAPPVLVTTVTPTGAARVSSLFGALSNAPPTAQAQHAFLPYDTPAAVRRFLRRVNPRCLIVMETELWPNLLRICTSAQLPVVLASARISSRTAARYAALRQLFARSLATVHVGAQTAVDAERLRNLGVLDAHLHVTGNIKFDIEIAPNVRRAGLEFRSAYLQGRPVWIAGSTHEGEELQMLAAHQAILATQPQALLILAPRHPQRFQVVAALLKAQGISFATRSSGVSVTPKFTVLLLDTLGELTMFYATCDVAFVGGSLVPVGGHNVLEPAALSLPVLTGPYTFNGPDVVQRMSERAALRYVYSAAELAAVVLELLRDPIQRARLGTAANAVIQESRGALTKLVALIEQVCGV